MAVEEDKVLAKGYELVAGQVYLLMKKEYHVSRNVRLQWFLEHINSSITVDDPVQKHGKELIVLSVVPLDPPSEWSHESSHLYHYLVSSSTDIICLSESYSAVFCLDMSPSISTVDIQRGRVMIDEILISLRSSVEGFINNFRLPGSTKIFEPIVFVTVIVHTPFFTTPAQQVLVQGWKLTKLNVVEFLSAIEKQLQLLEDNIAHVSGLVHDQLAEFRMRQADSEKLVGGLFEENTEKLVLPSKTEISMVSPDSGFINLLRYGMLALRLLPPSSCPNLIVITDGMITLPDIHVLDSVLSQLRNNAVAVSFLHVGSQFHPHCALGLVPYVELMQFIALATTGSYIPSPPAVVFPDTLGKMNVYQHSFLSWSFMKGSLGIEPCSGELFKGEWCVRNRRFDGNREPQLLTKKQSEDSLNATLASVLCCRMREGYFVKSVYLKDDTVDLCLVLPWSNHIYIEYYVSSDWPSSESVRYGISIKAPYEFLHDITCLIKKPFQSPYRQAVVSRFWSTLKTLNHADLLLSHLDSFQNNPSTYTLPDSIRSGMPLFYLPSDSSQPVLSSNDTSCPQFAHFWRLISALDPGVWQKWLHTHRLGVVLTHDRPLPQFLHTPNPNGRFQSVQCRYAASTLFNFLKDWTSFVLIENHSYIKFITPSESYDKIQTWFFIMRVTSKPPCVVLHVAFLGNTPGYLRNLAIETLKEKLSELKFPIRPTKKEQRQTSRKLPEIDGDQRDQQQQMTECCMLLKKPLEKMLIRYERMPSEFGTVVFPDGTQPLIAAKPLRPPSSLVTTLSRYLYHRRWVWSASARPGTSYSFGRAPLARLLANLTRIRLDEGFRFAHSTAGIINMVLEVNMKCFDEGTKKTDILPCVIQYVLFPPHTVFVTPKNGNSDDEGAEEDQNELIVELISECWIEPQHGVVTRSPFNRSYMENLRYYQLADVMWWNDAECISSLLTFEHLRLMCQDSSVVIPEPITLKTLPNPLEKWPQAVALADERIQKVPFAYNLMNILPKCQQAQILFSLFIQELCGSMESKCSADMPNCLLLETFYDNLKDLHDRDMCLSKEDSKKLIDLIIQREKDNVSLAEEVKEFADGSNSTSGSSETLEVPMINDWKRMISWATGMAESTDKSGKRAPGKRAAHIWQRRNKAGGSAMPVQWRCFVKALSSSRCILTLVPASFQDVKALADEEFPASRLRANSWDMVRQTASVRARTSSVGSRVTNTSASTSTSHASYSCGAITLPLFVYDCLVSNLIDQNCVKTGNDIFIDKTKETADDPASEQNSENSDISLEELSLREHCKMVMQSFNNAFVVSLFKSLRLGNGIHAADVKTAVEECEESSVEIDITNYLKIVCGHLKELLAENRDESNTTEGDVLLSVFKHPGPCLDYKHLHKLIKNKFLRILTASFKAVPSDPKYYFCSPMWERDRQVVSTPFGHDDSCRVLESSNEFDSLHFSGDMSDFRCDQISMHGQSVWEGVGSVTTPDEARTSLIANMDSDSISNFPDDESIEDVSPLFLHLDCSLNSGGETNNCTVKIIPTCLNELLDVDDNKFEKLDLNDLSVVLRLVLTAKSSVPQPQLQPPQPPSVTQAASTAADIQQAHCAGDRFQESAIAELLHHLPENQQKAVVLCVREIEWLMHDEIAAFLLDAVPVTEQTLKFVSNHVVSSTNRPSCLFEQVPLKFVFGLERSMSCFLKDLAQMAIPCYCLKKEGDYYFLIKDENGLKTQKLNEESFCNYGQTSDFWISSGGSQTNEDKKSIDSPSWNRLSDLRSFSQEFNKSSVSGWSSVAAWHHNVSSLMENGLAAEDIYNMEHMDETSDWLTDLEKRRAILPNFWLIMKVDNESVSTYFHCRFLELETQKVKLYSLIQRSIVKNISQVCKIVNQTMLLQNLHNTRLCNSLLEPETTDDDSWTSSPKIKLQVGSNETENEFAEGMFACNVVWKTHFALHPRLKTGPGKPRLSRGIQALQTVLNRFSVNNRKNMFVYQDKNENVFYLRLYEKTQIRTIDVEDISPGSVSRSSSINSLNREYNKRLLDDQLSANKEPPRPRLKSFGESGDTFSSKQEDFITLQVHGISEAGSEVKLELVQVLQNRLNDAVLEVVSVMLARNPMCKLSPEDVHFIQKPNHTPDNFIKFTIPLHANNQLQALAFYLRQNLLQFLYMPKYTDSRTHNHFQDYSYPNDPSRKIPEENMFLYNQSPSSGNKGIACIGFALVNADGCLVTPKDCPLPSSDAYKKNPLSESEFNNLTDTETISDEQITGTDASTFIEFRVWKQGRVNIESLTQMLKASIRHTLWDLLMEFNLLTAPLTRPSTDDETSVASELAAVHQSISVPWLKLAVTLGVPAVKPLYINLTARHSVDVTLREVYNLISVSDTTGFVFYKSSDEADDKFVYLHQVNSAIEIPVSSCIIIGRNMNYWKACHTNDPESLAVRIDKAHSISSHFPPFYDASSDPMMFVPRQRFLLAVVTSKNITIYTYNWAKERIELLKKHVSNLGQWLSARCSLLTGILAQKLGLFHNKPYARKTTGQSGLSHATDVESLISFSLQPIKQQRSSGSGIAQLSEVLRDTKPISCKKINSSDPVILNVQRILDSRNDEKRDHQKKLYMMWQARGATPNIPLAEDILQIFIQHSRNIHYCLTPLLFLPRWRIQSAATRDHSLKVAQASSSDISASKTDDKWHQQLCNNFVHEYKQYLQSLGFIPIQIGPSTPKKGTRRNSLSRSTKNSCFLQKSLLGGILLFELFLSEPFFHTKLHALECSRLQTSTPLLSQFIMSFLDECDRVKILMHLHSFTYDYHLRCLHWFISNKQVLLRPCYHITSFLDDFIKYYTKAPNYARSLVFSDSMLIREISTPAMQLFNYLLNNEKDYKMEVYCMLPSSENTQENEFVLVQLSQTPQITYKDAHDMKQTDDFDVTLMVAQQDNPDPNSLALHFYLLLTSRRELYPNLEIERKLGKFCPVSTVTLPTESDDFEKRGDILAVPIASNDSTQHNEIRPESVNYLGYYSSHEQLMQQLILEQAEAARRHILWMTSQGSLDCRTHLLWNKLMSNYPLNNTLSYGELVELCSLAQVDLLSAIDPRLSSLLAQSLTWYQSLVKVLTAKYSDLCRTFTSPDNNIQHFLILHPKLMKGFVMLTLDLLLGRGEMSVVCRKSHRHDQHDVSTTDLHSLIEGVVNATCFHLWTGLL